MSAAFAMLAAGPINLRFQKIGAAQRTDVEGQQATLPAELQPPKKGALDCRFARGSLSDAFGRLSQLS
jgi:hypothetical protein